MALLKFLKGNYAGLNNAAIKEGQVLICGDTGEMFVDVAADKRVKIGDFITVANIAALEALDATAVPTSRLYYVEDGNILARSNGTTWVQVNKQKTADELKTMLGLGTLAYKSEVAEADLKADLATKINNKVDKVEGKSLVLDTEITKLAGVSEGANKVEKSETNGNIKIDGVETVVYTHPAKHQITDIEGLQDALDGKQGSGNFAAENHTHTKDQITDFAHTHIASEITDLDATIKTYNYATKAEAEGYANAKDAAIAEAKKAGDDAQAYAEGVAGDLAEYETANDAALAAVKATADAAVTDAKLATALEPYAKTADADAKYETIANVNDVRTLAQKGVDDAKAAQDDVDALAEFVGTLPEGRTEETIVAYIDAKTAGVAADADLSDLADRVKTIEDDYLVEADKTELANATTAVADRVKALEDADFTGKIATAKQEAIDAAATDAKTKADAAEKAAKEYAKGYADGLIGSLEEGDTLAGLVADEAQARKDADKDLQEQITANANAITLLTDGVDVEKVDGVKDLIDYVDKHGTEVTGMKADIAANAKAISDHEALAAETYETKTDAAAKLAEAKADASNKDAVVLAEAQGYADEKAAAAKDAAIADAATKYETIGTAQGIVDGLKLDETYEPIGAENRAIAAAKTETENQVKALADGAVATNAGNIAKNAEEIAKKANSADVYAKTETYTQAEVDAAIEAAVSAAHTWGSF